MPDVFLSAQWHGSLADPSELHQHDVQAGHDLADASRAGDWTTVLRMLDSDGFRWDANTWRPGGDSWFTPLHQAAWHGAPLEVVDALLDRGGWRSLRTSEGLTAADIASRRGHHHLGETLKLPAPPRTPRETTTILDRHLADMIDRRIRPHIRSVLRYPQSEVLLDLPEGAKLWFPVPGMYGGFSIEMRRGYLDVESWSRIVGGSGQAHVVTVEGTTLVAEGFV